MLGAKATGSAQRLLSTPKTSVHIGTKECWWRLDPPCPIIHSFPTRESTFFASVSHSCALSRVPLFINLTIHGSLSYLIAYKLFVSLQGEIRELRLVGDPQAFQDFCDYDDYADEVSFSVIISIKANRNISLTHSLSCLRVLEMMATERLIGSKQERR